MMNSIVTNVIPPDVPSARRGITPFGQSEQSAVENKQQTNPVTKVDVQADSDNSAKIVKTNADGDKFEKHV